MNEIRGEAAGIGMESVYQNYANLVYRTETWSEDFSIISERRPAETDPGVTGSRKTE